MCESGAEETLRHFLKECRGFGDIRKIHDVREEDEIEELLLFCDQDKKKTGKRKKYLDDLWRERTRQVQRRAPQWRGVKKEEHESPVPMQWQDCALHLI